MTLRCFPYCIKFRFYLFSAAHHALCKLLFNATENKSSKNIGNSRNQICFSFFLAKAAELGGFGSLPEPNYQPLEKGEKDTGLAKKYTQGRSVS